MTRINIKIDILTACLLLLITMLAGCDEQPPEIPQKIVADLERDAGGVYGGAHHPPLTRPFETLVTTGDDTEC